MEIRTTWDTEICLKGQIYSLSFSTAGYMQLLVTEATTGKQATKDVTFFVTSNNPILPVRSCVVFWPEVPVELACFEETFSAFHAPSPSL